VCRMARPPPIVPATDMMSQRTTPNLADPGFKANPHPFYAQLQAEAPVYRARLPNRQDAWLLTRYDDVAAALRDPRLVKDRANATSGG
jgi:cytochrome P450